METYLVFTDESGCYNKERSSRSLSSNPFYVRSNIIINLEDYLKLQEGVDKIKASYGLSPDVEVKWSHYGNIIKNNRTKIKHNLFKAQVEKYFDDCLSLLSTMKSLEIYYTFTDNKAVPKIDEVKLIKMHLQNAYQRVQKTVEDKNGFAIVIADDLNDKTKKLKESLYELTNDGDYYVKYSNIKRGLYIDYSDLCCGLQIADLCAGAFTASLKYLTASKNEKNKYLFGYNLFFSNIYIKTRNQFIGPDFIVYKSGVKEVPNKAGDKLAKEISGIIADKLKEDLLISLRDDFDDFLY